MINPLPPLPPPESSTDDGPLDLTPRANVYAGPDGNLYLQRCPRCYIENYNIAVATGRCYSCGYLATPADITSPA